MKNYKKIIAFNSAIAILSSTILLSSNTMTASAISCRKDSFDKSRYTLTGNMAEDVAAIAKSQKGRTRRDFAYTEAWCDEFVADCIENAGGDSNIVGHGSTVNDFMEVMKKKGAKSVSTPQVGDLVFFSWGHVEIVTKVVNGVPYCTGGNNGEGEGFCRGERKVRDVGKSFSYLRPNYTKGKNIIENKTTYNNPFNYTIPTRILKLKSPMMNGDDVRWLQSALTYLGYGCSVDGFFGNDTRSKVIAYQQAKGLSADGIVGNATLTSLKSNVNGTNEAKSDGKTTATTNYNTPSRTLRLTSPLQTGEDVKWLQAALNKLNGAGLTVDGMFGKNTYNAVKAFQQINGLSVDGIVGTNTRGKINALLNDSNYVPPEAAVSSITQIGYTVPTSTLRYGSKGDKVRWLQVALNCTISSGLAIDGHYGTKTQNAVKKYQLQNGLTADGICGPKTFSKLKATLSSMNIVAGGSAVPSVASIEFANKEKHIYATEESIPFTFDSDSGETYQLVVLNDKGEEVYKYVTDEYKLSINLDPGEYTAYVTAINDKGSVSSEKVDFTVINQSKIDDGAIRISSNSNIYLSYDMKKNVVYADENINYESVWHICSYDDWTFKIINSYCNKELAIVDGKLVAEDVTDDNDKALWYLYEEDEMKFIKNKDSDLALTVSSDGEVLVDTLDTSSYAQALNLEKLASGDAELTRIDDTHIHIEWENIPGVSKYMVAVYDSSRDLNSIDTMDDFIYYTETTDLNCEFEVPFDVDYKVYISSFVGDDLVVGAEIDENGKVEESTEPSTEISDNTEIVNEYELSSLIQLQRYLLGETNYDLLVVSDLDMNLDGKIDVVDSALLKEAILN